MVLVTASRDDALGEEAVYLAANENFAFLAITIFSVFELGTSPRERSGCPHVPAFAASGAEETVAMASMDRALELIATTE